MAWLPESRLMALALVAFLALVVPPVVRVEAQKEACMTGQLYAYDLEDCHRFYACLGGIPVGLTCPADLVFSLSEKACVFRDSIWGNDCLSKSQKENDQKEIVSVLKGVEEGDNFVEEESDKPKDEKAGHSGEDGGSIHDSDMYKEMDKLKGSMDDYEQMDEYKKKLATTTEPPMDSYETMGDDYEKMDEYKKKFGDKGTTEAPMDSYEEMDGEYKEMDEYKDKFENEVQGIFATDQRCRDVNSKVVPHESLCHRYYNCTNPRMGGLNRYLTPYEYECPYPKLFSTTSLRCEDFDAVDCGDRMEYLDPCEYSENMCSGPNCAPCPVDHASCIEQPDGLMYWPGREGSGFWVECRNQRTVSQGNCGHGDNGLMRMFSSEQRKCVSYSEAIDEVCYWTKGQLPHPTECHLYYDCTTQSKEKFMGPMSSSDAYLKTCPYPQLYSVRTGQCEDYDQVTCGARREAKSPCDYMECVDYSYASCEGLEDGLNAFRSREGTPHYVICKNGRTLEKKVCPVDARGLFMEFAPGLRQCVSS